MARRLAWRSQPGSSQHFPLESTYLLSLERTHAVVRALSFVPVVGGYAMSEFERLGMETTVRLANAAARRELGVEFRPLEETVRDGVAAMIDGGFVQPRPRHPHEYQDAPAAS